MNTQIIQIARKNIYLTDNHHEVLLPWAMERERHGKALFILTLDHHTDTLPAFTHASEIAGHPVCQKADFRDHEAIVQALKILRHDEHFDYALQNHIIAGAWLFTHENFSLEHDARLHIIHEPPASKDLSALQYYYSRALESEFLTRQLQLAALTPDQLPEPFVLDIDLDYFKGRNSIQPEDSRIFSHIVRQATAITISRETDWVRLLNMDFDRSLNSDYFQVQLLSKIRQILQERPAE